MARKHTNIRVKKDEINPETPEILAASLIRIADAFTALLEQGELKTEAIVALLLDHPEVRNKVSKRDITLVLENLAKLKSYYVRAKPKH